MQTLWFILLCLMLATYVALDGFDFGVGIVHLFTARTDDERRANLAAIGPVWDGNEVWLLASGGILVFAFPRAYAAGFSGFYLPLMMALWLLILRGLAIEFRSKEANPLWRSFWDGTFFFASTLMSIILGAALGCIIRGVPLDSDGYFAGPLFTNFQTGDHPGVLDWYTVTMGVFTAVILAGHGLLYLAMKTSGDQNARAKAFAARVWPAVVIVGIPATIGSYMVRPELYHNLAARPWAWPLVLLAFCGLACVFINLRNGREAAGFLSSCCFIVCLLASTAAGVYPTILRSTTNPAYSLNAANASTGELGLRVGLGPWLVAICLAIGYFVFLFRSFSGKVTLSSDGHSY